MRLLCCKANVHYQFLPVDKIQEELKQLFDTPGFHFFPPVIRHEGRNGLHIWQCQNLLRLLRLPT